jgi:hypothetical protein
MVRDRQEPAVADAGTLDVDFLVLLTAGARPGYSQINAGELGEPRRSRPVGVGRRRPR